MLHQIREVRRAKGYTLLDVAERCYPPTTAQTIGRLETGTRTLSLDWLDRIAGALGVDASELVQLPDQEGPVAAHLGIDGVHAPTKADNMVAPRLLGEMVGLRVMDSIGDYRHGDEIWCEQMPSERFAEALNCDVLVPRPAGRFLFGRLLGREDGKLRISPLAGPYRQQIVADPAWIARAARLLRSL